MQTLSTLYQTVYGSLPTAVLRIAGSGSNRQYYRMEGAGGSVIGVHGTSQAENHAFIGMARHFKAAGLHVPTVLAASADELHYLTEDLGSVALFDLLHEPNLPLLEKTVRALPAFQYKAAQGLDFGLCYPQPSFDKRNVLWDLNYFKYDFLKPAGIEFEENLLEDDFERFAHLLLAEQTETFMYRDFQSRNIFIKNNEPWFIDFQGGRKGPIYYDLASFLYQAKAGFSEELREHLVQVYLQALQPFRTLSRTAFDKQWPWFVLFRVLQTLGAYGFRGLIEHKAHFIQSIPPALHNLQILLDTYDYSQLPYLSRLLHTLLTQYRPEVPPTSGELWVRIYSFSYKKGCPIDYSGNGGGFVFDCRYLPNPGRYEPYKQLTGLDAPVIRFIEENGEMQAFLNAVYALADAAVARYQQRGFTNLQFCFGCTGGQHRSVYAAEHLAEHLSQHFGVTIRLEHRERGMVRVL